jgi:hypothetical protein
VGWEAQAQALGEAQQGACDTRAATTWTCARTHSDTHSASLPYTHTPPHLILPADTQHAHAHVARAPRPRSLRPQGRGPVKGDFLCPDPNWPASDAARNNDDCWVGASRDTRTPDGSAADFLRVYDVRAALCNVGALAHLRTDPSARPRAL